jgi:hypothetical protein
MTCAVEIGRGGEAATAESLVTTRRIMTMRNITAIIAAAAVGLAALFTPAIAHAAPELQPGPHSALADVDLPAGTVPAPPDAFSGPGREDWRFTAPYDDTVTFLQRQFATGRRYDSYGATWWKGLPPCYNDSKYNPTDPAHESPPRGWIDWPAGGIVRGVPPRSTIWRWSDGAIELQVQAHELNKLDAQGNPTGTLQPYVEIEIAIYSTAGLSTDFCNRA